MSINASFKFIARSVTTMLILGGILLLVVGYPVNLTDMTGGGWGLIIFGITIYVIELIIRRNSDED